MEYEAQLQLSLCLPIQEQANSPRRKVMGDPGTTEHFELPKYAYIFVMKDNGDGTWGVWRNDWICTHYYGLNETRGDSIYKYNKPIQYLLRNETPIGRVYAVCCNKRLSFNSAFKNIADLDELLDWKFNSAPDSIQQDLQNIYSTPYNCTRNGKYYCSFDCSAGNFCSVDLLMYHIASKVDIKWNVADSVRINSDPSKAVRLTYMEARRLFNGQAYCFKPMQNKLAAMPGNGEGYDIPDMVTPADEGLWWEGRSYFYTIPYYVEGEPNYFPLQMLLGTNGTKETAGYELTLNQPMDTSAVFVPWLRGNFNLSKPLGATAVTKNISSNP